MREVIEGAFSICAAYGLCQILSDFVAKPLTRYLIKRRLTKQGGKA